MMTAHNDLTAEFLLLQTCFNQHGQFSYVFTHVIQRDPPVAPGF